MKSVRRLLGCAVLAAAAIATQASAYSSLIVFGDSLSDPGNAAALTAGASGPFFPPAPYAGTFSNGPTAAQYLAASYGAPVVPGWPNATGATNFAVGGALTGAGNYNFTINSPSGLTAGYPQVGGTGIAQQITRYNPSGLNAADTLFMLWGGPNDIFLALAQAQAGIPVSFAAVVTQAVTNMAGNIAALAALGAKSILVPNMPDLGLTPFALGAGLGALTTGITDSFNAGLKNAIGLQRMALAPLGVNLYEFDSAQSFRSTIAAPPPGITQVTTSCLSGGLAAIVGGCAGYLFFDDVHPTTFAHSLIASQLAAAAVPIPEPGTWALMTAGIALLGWRARRRR